MKKIKRQNNIQRQNFLYYQNQALRKFAEGNCWKFEEVKLAKFQCHIMFEKSIGNERT